MAYKLKDTELNSILKIISKQYEVYAPTLFEGHGTFSDTDIINYGKIDNSDQIVFDKKSTYSFKETLLQMSETLFYFTEDEMKAPTASFKKAVIFLRNCDFHALKRLDDIYLANGERDFYYERLRNNAKFIVIGSKTVLTVASVKVWEQT